MSPFSGKVSASEVDGAPVALGAEQLRAWA